ncbi:MAG: glycoside hydrolase family 13 protein [Phycisphaerales bacterium]|nr:glycoside hydrolase family 13 protein [Phycisphaerales bacterium]
MLALLRTLATVCVSGSACAQSAEHIQASGDRPVPEHAVTFTPISRGLGLGDIIVTLDVEPARVRADSPEFGTLELHKVAAPSSRPTFRARIKRRADAPKELVFSVRIIDAAEAVRAERKLGPFTMTAWPEPKFETPDWAKGAVWYQIFPERFFNGHPGNDPIGPWVYPSAWTSDWLAVTPDEIDAARARSSAQTFETRKSGQHSTGAFRDVVFDRRYGGDLQGIERKLNYISDLGATAIYLNPIFHAQTMHKYDATDYRHIDPTFGDPGDHPTLDLPRGETTDPATWTWTPADKYFVDQFLPACKHAKLRIILDGVWNHVGTSHWAFADVVRHGDRSPYAHWFRVQFADEKTYPDWKTHTLDLAPGRLAMWHAWNGRNGGLPSFNRTADRLHPDVERHIFDVTRRWMDPNNDGDPSDGIDGWRLDVAADVPMGFWEAWRPHVKSINPDAVLQAEIWYDARDYFDGRAFDGQMNYPFLNAVLDFIARRPKTDASWLATRLGEVFNHAPQVDLTQMNLLGSHDTERLLTRIDRLLNVPTSEVDQPGAPTLVHTPPSDLARRLSLLGLAFQIACPGAPMIYAGDEMGVWGGNDPDCRRPLPWPELGPQANPDLAHAPIEHTNHYRTWLKLRSHPEIGDALRWGDLRIIASADPDVIVVERQLNRTRVRIAINRGERTFDSAGIAPGGFRRLSLAQADSAADPQALQAVSAGVWVRNDE